MKAIILLAGFAIGICLGVYPGINKSKPLWWRVAVLAIVSTTVFAALYPPLAGTFRDVVIVSRMDSLAATPVAVRQVGTKHLFDPETKKWSVAVQDYSIPPQQATLLTSENEYTQAKQFQGVTIVRLQRNSSDVVYNTAGIVALDPFYTLPYIIGLEERARILYFHVPAAWIASLAYILAMVYGVVYLRKKDLTYDVLSSSAAVLGTLFCILATTTGAVWAQYNWGKFWSWDPRQISIFVLLLVYSAYFILRASVANPIVRARLAAVYSVVAATTVPFFMFIAPRLYDGLHPGSRDDVNAGPVISADADALNITKQIILSMAFASYLLLFYWMMSLNVRIKQLQSRSTV